MLSSQSFNRAKARIAPISMSQVSHICAIPVGSLSYHRSLSVSSMTVYTPHEFFASLTVPLQPLTPCSSKTSVPPRRSVSMKDYACASSLSMALNPFSSV